MRILAIAALGMVSAAPAAPPHADDVAPVPRNMVAFVTGDGCPSGWVVETLSAGRVLVGSDDDGVIGRVVGDPLADQEVREHGHGVAAMSIELPYKSISAADGGNHAGAAAGARPVSGAVSPAASGLPFVQLTTCRSP
jgi:hypothetical protein